MGVEGRQIRKDDASWSVQARHENQEEKAGQRETKGQSD